MTGDDNLCCRVNDCEAIVKLALGSYALLEGEMMAWGSLVMEVEDQSRPWALAQEGCPLR
jgi:hypothetical protein